MTRVRRGGRPDAAALLLTAAILAAGGVGAARARAPYSTWIESRAPQAFDRHSPVLAARQVRYRVDAHILLPLGFTALELWNSPGVGTAVASYRDCEAAAGEVMRAFELFGHSYPERAHGFDRRGLFREVLHVLPDRVAWTAYFGAMTSWPEKTLGEAKKSADGAQPHTYEVIDGLSAPLEGRAAVFRVDARGQYDDSAALWGAVRPRLDAMVPRTVLSLAGSEVRPLPALAFIGALETSLRAAAARRGKPPGRVPFVHNGVVRQLEIASMTRDAGRGRRAVASGLASNAADVFELRYRIVNPGQDDGAFKLWAELPADTRSDVLSPPLPPLGWELRLRAYLKLVFERVS
jgi:hypothetical protein